MKRTCDQCHEAYDDLYCITFCPHRAFEMHCVVADRVTNVQYCCHTVEETKDPLRLARKVEDCPLYRGTRLQQLWEDTNSQLVDSIKRLSAREVIGHLFNYADQQLINDFYTNPGYPVEVRDEHLRLLTEHPDFEVYDRLHQALELLQLTCADAIKNSPEVDHAEMRH